jgi:hypothetical protein
MKSPRANGSRMSVLNCIFDIFGNTCRSAGVVVDGKAGNA